MSSWVAVTVQQLCQSNTDFSSKVYGAPIDHALEFHLPANKPKEDRFCIRRFRIASCGVEAQHVGNRADGSVLRAYTSGVHVHFSHFPSALGD